MATPAKRAALRIATAFTSQLLKNTVPRLITPNAFPAIDPSRILVSKPNPKPFHQIRSYSAEPTTQPCGVFRITVLGQALENDWDDSAKEAALEAQYHQIIGIADKFNSHKIDVLPEEHMHAKLPYGYMCCVYRHLIGNFTRMECFDSPPSALGSGSLFHEDPEAAMKVGWTGTMFVALELDEKKVSDMLARLKAVPWVVAVEARREACKITGATGNWKLTTEEVFDSDTVFDTE